MSAPEVSEVVRRRALEMGAESWLEALPALVEDIANEWSIRLGEPMTGGTEAFVVEATLEDGSPAVLKLLVPHEDGNPAGEIAVLERDGGRGCARLHRHDAARGALLLERLGPCLHDLGWPVARQHEVLCATAKRLWQPAPGLRLWSGAEKGAWLRDTIASLWEETGRACSERAVDHARACAERRIRGHDDDRAVLVHGDLHAWNTLQSLDDPDTFRAIDPDGLLAEPEYDLGIVMREDPVPLLEGDPRARSRRLAALTGRDEQAIWEWGVVERVSSGLLCVKLGIEPEGRDMLAAAEAVAE